MMGAQDIYLFMRKSYADFSLLGTPYSVICVHSMVLSIIAVYATHFKHWKKLKRLKTFLNLHRTVCTSTETFGDVNVL